jgi:hypothetical protein
MRLIFPQLFVSMLPTATMVAPHMAFAHTTSFMTLRNDDCRTGGIVRWTAALASSQFVQEANTERD